MKENNDSDSDSDQSSSKSKDSQDLLSNKTSEKKSGSAKDSKMNLFPETPPEQEMKKTD